MIKKPVFIWIICEQCKGPTEISEMYLTREEAEAEQYRYKIPTEIKKFQLHELFFCDVCKEHKPERINNKYCADCHIKECEEFGEMVQASAAWRKLNGN